MQSCHEHNVYIKHEHNVYIKGFCPSSNYLFFLVFHVDKYVINWTHLHNDLFLGPLECSLDFTVFENLDFKVFT